MNRFFILFFVLFALPSFGRFFPAMAQLEIKVTDEQYPLEDTYNKPKDQVAQESLYSAIFQANLDNWHEELRKNVLLLETKWRADFELKKSVLQRDFVSSANKELTHLRDAANLNQGTNASLEAQFLLGLRLLTAKETAKEGEGLLRRFAQRQITEDREGFLGMRAQAHLQLASLSLSRGELLDAEANLRMALSLLRLQKKENRSAPSLRQEYFALVVLADISYRKYFYNTAEDQYAQALQLVTGAPLPVYQELADQLPSLYVRLVWTSFRGGRNSSAISYASQYARKRGSWKRLPAANVETELIRAAGVSLFENSSPSASQALAADPLAGDFGKLILLRSLSEFRNSARFSAGTARGKSLESYFVQSSSALKFYEEMALLSEGDKSLIGKFNYLSKLIELARASSQWSRKFARPFPEVMQERRGFILKYALQTANYFDAEFETSGRKVSALSCFDAYQARLEDRDEVEDKHALLVYAGRAALRASFYNEAISLSEESFRFGLPQKQSLEENPSQVGKLGNLLAGPAREQLHIMAYENLIRALQLQQQLLATRMSLSELARKPLVEKYLLAVDLFVREYPRLVSSRNYLFESASRLERYNRPQEALERYQRVLSVTPAEQSDELNAVLHALVLVHTKNSPPEEAARALGGLESFSENRQISGSVRTEVQLGSEASIRKLVAEQRLAGESKKAAVNLYNWARSHKTNPEAAVVSRDAVIAFLEIGELARAKEVTRFFLESFPNHTYSWEIWQLSAYCHETMLSFRVAALHYMRSSFEDKSNLSISHRLDNLKRASLFFAELGELEQSATLNQQAFELHLRSGQSLLAINSLEETGDRFFKGGAFERGSQTYARAADFVLRSSQKIDYRQRELNLRLKAFAARSKLIALTENELRQAHSSLRRLSEAEFPSPSSDSQPLPNYPAPLLPGQFPVVLSRTFWAEEISRWENQALAGWTGSGLESGPLSQVESVEQMIARSIQRLDSLLEKDAPEVLLQRAIAYEKFANALRKMNKKSRDADDRELAAKDLFFKSYLQAKAESSTKEMAATFLKKYTLISSDASARLLPEVPR